MLAVSRCSGATYRHRYSMVVHHLAVHNISTCRKVCPTLFLATRNHCGIGLMTEENKLEDQYCNYIRNTAASFQDACRVSTHTTRNSQIKMKLIN